MLRIIEEEDTHQVLLSKQAPLTPKWVWGWKGGVRLGGWGARKGFGGGQVLIWKDQVGVAAVAGGGQGHQIRTQSGNQRREETCSIS